VFDWTKGRALATPADDLQDLLASLAVPAVGGEVLAFGAVRPQPPKPIDRDFGNVDGLHGIHDIHLNQGTSHARTTAYQDGGLCRSTPTGSSGGQERPDHDHRRVTAARASVAILLDGDGVQLGNKGGNLILRSPDGQQADVVVYTADDARPDDRYLRFHR
jgi:hypothetical protein